MKLREEFGALVFRLVTCRSSISGDVLRIVYVCSWLARSLVNFSDSTSAIC